jgi:hypothetical protein
VEPCSQTIERVLRRPLRPTTARLSKRRRGGVVRRQPIDPRRKAEALKLATEHGSAEASRWTGVSADTIRYWRHKAATAPRSRDADVNDVERLERLARDLRAAAEEALAKAREAIAAGRGAEAKNLAMTAGVAVDKCGELRARCRPPASIRAGWRSAMVGCWWRSLRRLGPRSGFR